MLALFDLAEFAETRPAGVMECGHSVYNLDHYSECLNLTCPRCGLTEDGPYLLQAHHGPHENGHVDLCSVSMNAIDHSGCCLGCQNYTFGHSDCIFEHCPRYVAGHGSDFHSDDHSCKACGVPSRMIWKWGAW